MNEKVSRAADALAESYTGDGVKIHHLDRRPLPSRTEAVRVLDALQELLFPGYTGAQGLTGAAAGAAGEFISRLPQGAETLASDVKAAYEGDPAAVCYDEIIFSYPGLYAVTVYRLAHELHLPGVPLIPRIMTEPAHARTGIDIHPGTQLGHSFFIDHGTGVVVGGTAVIGNNVKLYQGVTIGAFSFAKDAAGQR